MPRRSAVFIVAVALIGGWAPGAVAAPLPTLGAADGVTAERTAKGVEIRLAGTAAQAAARYAGRDLVVRCDPHPAPGLLLGRGSTEVRGWYEPVRLRRAGDALVLELVQDADQLQDVATWDACVVQRPPLDEPYHHDGPFLVRGGEVRPALARAALTPAGTAWLADVDAAIGLTAAATPLLADGRAYPTVAAAAAKGVTPLDGPDASPPVGAVGYWADPAGGRAALVAASRSGRRLIIQDLGGGMFRSNLFAFGADLVGAGAVTYELDESGDHDRGSPPGEEHDVLRPADGIRSSVHGRVVRARFTGTAGAVMRRLAGRRVTVLCGRAPRWTARPLLGEPTAWIKDYTSAVVRVPAGGAGLRVRLPGAAVLDVCSIIDDGSSVAQLAPTEAGRGYLADARALASLFSASDAVAARGATAYRSTAAIVAAAPRRLAALAAPDAPAPAGRVGVWSGGTTIVLATRSPTGRSLLYADDGDGIMRTNALPLLGSFFTAG